MASKKKPKKLKKKLQSKIWHKNKKALILAVVFACIQIFLIIRLFAATPNFNDYLLSNGGQEIVVPNGTYTAGGVVNASHDDWLIIKAQSKGGVVVDLKKGELKLENSSKIIFVGIKFINGRVYHKDSNNISYWYTEHTFPISDPCDGPWECGSRDPARVIQVHGSDKINFYGVDVHDIGSDGFRFTSIRNSKLLGTRVWGLSHGSDPNDYIHSDVIQTTGRSSNVLIQDSYFEGGPFQIGTDKGDVSSFTWDNVWAQNSTNRGFGFGSSRNKDNLSEIYTNLGHIRRNIFSWNHNNGHDRIDTLQAADGSHKHYYAPNYSNSKDRVSVTETDIRTYSPTGSNSVDVNLNHQNNPAIIWRNLNKYDNFAQYLGLSSQSTEIQPEKTEQGTSNSDQPKVYIKGASNNQTISGKLQLEATIENVGSPSIDFYIDNNFIRTEKTPPYCLAGDGGESCFSFDTREISDGQHVFKVVLRSSKGSDEKSISLNIANANYPIENSTPNSNTYVSEITNSVENETTGLELTNSSNPIADDNGAVVINPNPSDNDDRVQQIIISAANENSKFEAIDEHNNHSSYIANGIIKLAITPTEEDVITKTIVLNGANEQIAEGSESAELDTNSLPNGENRLQVISYTAEGEAMHSELIINVDNDTSITNRILNSIKQFFQNIFKVFIGKDSAQ